MVRPAQRGRGRSLVAAGAAMALLTVPHVFAVRDPTIGGPALVLDHIFNIALATGLLVLCAGIGLPLLRRAGIGDDSAIETLAFSAALGTGVLATGILLVGAAGGLHVLAMSALLLGAGALVRRELATMPDLMAAALQEFRVKAGRPALGVFIVVAAVMLILAVAPPTDWDSLMYHLQVPAQFLERGFIHVPEDNLHVSYVGLFHMLYLPLLAYGAAPAAALLNVIMTLVLGAVLLTAGTRLFSPTPGRLALVLLWGSPLMILGGTTPRVDVVLACYLFLAHYAVLRAWRTPDQATQWITLAGLLLGFSVGIKFLALPYIAALSPVVLLTVFAAARTHYQRGTLLLIFGGLLLLAAAPWLIKNWILLGAPLYPRFAERMLPPWLAAIYGSAGVPEAVDPASLGPLRSVRESFNLGRWFFSPQLLTPEGEGGGYGANWIYLLLLPGLILVRSRTFVGLLLPAIGHIAIVVGLGAFINPRYLMPAFSALTLGAVYVIFRGVICPLPPRFNRPIIVLLAFLSLIQPLQSVAGRLVGSSALDHAIGALSRDEYLRRNRSAEVAHYGRMTDAVNALVPERARVLLLFEGRGFGFSSHTLQDNLVTNWPLLRPALQDEACLETTGITHVLIATGVLSYYVSRGLDPNLMRLDELGTFVSRCLSLAATGPGWEIYTARSP